MDKKAVLDELNKIQDMAGELAEFAYDREQERGGEDNVSAFIGGTAEEIRGRVRNVRAELSKE